MVAGMSKPVVYSLCLASIALAEDPELQPSEKMPGLGLLAGTEAEIIADHANAGVTSPTALAFDGKGNLFVTETFRFREGIEDNRDRTYWMKEDVAAMSVEDRRKMFERYADRFPEGYFTKKSERVLRFAAAEGGGIAAKPTVFADGFNDPMDGTMAGVMVMDDVVYLACIPKVLGLVDQDADGKADVRKVIADGFGVKVSLSGHDLNGFALGPDGRIWGTVGDRGFSVVTREGKKYHFPDEGAVFRFDPDGSGFEVIHTGLRNPKEIDFDDFGNPVTVDNNSDQGDKARVVYIVDGGDSGWRMGHQVMRNFHQAVGFPEEIGNLWMSERRWEKQNEEQPAFMVPPVDYLTSGPSGLIFHPGTGYLEKESGRFLICDYGGGAASSGIWSFAVRHAGATLSMVEPRKIAWGITATDVDFSPSGEVVISDFEGGWKSHDGGRIVRLRTASPWRAEQAAEAAGLLSKGMVGRSLEELGGLLRHADRRVRLRAQYELTQSIEGFDVLRKAAEGGKGLERYHGIWGLGIMARRGAAARPEALVDDFADVPGGNVKDGALRVLSPLLKDADPEIRTQVVKTIGEIGEIGDVVNFAALLADLSPRVRFHAAIAAGRTKARGSMSYLWELLESSGEKDPYLRHAASYALALMSDPRQLSSLSTHPSAGVRLGAVVALGRQRSEGVAAFLQDASPAVRDAAILAIHDFRIEEAWPVLDSWMTSQQSSTLKVQTWRRLVHHAFQRATESHLRWMVEKAKSADVPIEVRREILQVLSLWKSRPVVDGVTGAWLPPADKVADAAALMQPELAKMVEGDGRLLGHVFGLVRDLGLNGASIPAERLLAIVRDPELAVDARLGALDLWLAGKPGDANEVLAGLANDANDEVASRVLRLVADTNPESLLPALRSAMSSDHAPRRQGAWKMVKDAGDKVPDEIVVEALNELGKKKGLDAAAVEILEAAEARKSAAVVEALAAYRKLAESSGDPLAAWWSAMEGGDAQRGDIIFRNHAAAQCQRCHQAGDDHAGGVVGPDLRDMGNKYDRRYLLEALVLPSAHVAPGYGQVMVTMKDGRTLGGALIRQDDAEIEIDMAGKREVLKRADVEQCSEPVSAMPPMSALLSASEIRDMVEWLATRKADAK
jgi:quinoprotein glucose dehydrogenase